MEHYYSNGKLLISGEYLVLDGAVSLALPTKFGQDLQVINNTTNVICWTSYNVAKECWFTAIFDLGSFHIIETNSTEVDALKVAGTLQAILQMARTLNPEFLLGAKGLTVSTHLTFPNEWGLGTSSTLINSIATWASVNPFELLEKSFGGSGYDIACAKHPSPITYQRNGIHPNIVALTFDPSFKEELFFVYLNEKQDSKEGIKMYRSLTDDKSSYIKEINQLTKDLILAKELKEFESLLVKHETILSQVLNIKPVKERLFSDFNGAVKSLGAWGGDFVLVTGKESYVKDYFTHKKYTTILSYDEMILA
ncbi:GYDIA family GHMP kinase [Wenyingzhuangia aestuarii]|uniref:GYDIA family GHMP kinase n=1 Tax=Wenyingzhuangia aestuarii TaxID=1647582 RepID=UPI00143B8560|nr:GYDIA family GHMP kinase [Wenyingzhuangia aestuarii]NJB83809.1 mevalonate kinase [Wenyingzhuangia aestuarii]